MKPKPYHKRKLSEKEKFDIATIMLFIAPHLRKKIYSNDKKKFADLSSKGIKPKRITNGYKILVQAKRMREYHITSYREDVKAGLFTKAELIESYPPRFRSWLWSKLEDVPYDINGDVSKMFIKWYRDETA